MRTSKPRVYTLDRTHLKVTHSRTLWVFSQLH